MAGSASSARPAQQRLRTIESASVAGMVFGALFIAVLILLTRQPGPDASPAEVREWFSDDGAGSGAITALYLTSFAVISLLWFIAVIRRRLGDREDRFFATVFLGSGLLIGGVMLVGSAMLAAPAYVVQLQGANAIEVGDYLAPQGMGWSLLSIHGPRLAAVFMLSMSTLVLRTGALPKWLAILGYVAALGLMVSPLVFREQAIVFPAWVILVSLVILIRRRELPATRQTTDEPTHVTS